MIIVAGAVKVSFFDGDDTFATGGWFAGSLQLFYTVCVVRVAACPPEVDCRGLFGGFV